MELAPSRDQSQPTPHSLLTSVCTAPPRRVCCLFVFLGGLLLPFVSQISIHVITNDRLTSLMRLVKSLQESHFLGDEVQLSFHVDVDADGELMDYLMVSTPDTFGCCCSVPVFGVEIQKSCFTTIPSHEK